MSSNMKSAASGSTTPSHDDDNDDDFGDVLAPGVISPSKDPNIVVHMRNVTKTYLLGVEGVPALRGVSVSIRRGEFIVILGKSGGGKTTMLNILGTIDRPTRGDLHIGGSRIDSKTPDSILADIRLRRIGFVFQTFNLLPTLTAVENVELPLILAGWGSARSRRKRALKLLARVGLSERAGHYPGMLSGGEQQRTTIARALVNKPDILLLDEPTGDLDGANSALILRILLDLNRKENVTCIMVTHDVSLKYYAHRVIHMVDGKISRLEEIAPFIRMDADEALSNHSAIKAMLAMEEAARKEKKIAHRLGKAWSASSARIAAASVSSLTHSETALNSTPSSARDEEGGGWDDASSDEDEDEGDEGHSGEGGRMGETVARRTRGVKGCGGQGGWSLATSVSSFFGWNRPKPPADATASTSPSAGYRETSASSSSPLPQPSSSSSSSSSSSALFSSPPTPTPSTASLRYSSTSSSNSSSSSSSSSSPFTSTGLSGTAAISHAVFSADFNGSGAVNSTSALAAPTSRTVVRAPSAYAPFQHAQKFRETERRETAERLAASVKHEEALREAIYAKKRGLV